MPKWRNWQTHETQNLAVVTPCRFKSDLRHILQIAIKQATKKPVKIKIIGLDPTKPCPPIEALAKLGRSRMTRKSVMFSDSCIFCKIILKKITPKSIILENEHVLVIPDINPKAPVHYLIIPKKHIIDLVQISEQDMHYAYEMLKATHEIGKNLNTQNMPKAFNIVSNNGAAAGQSVFHLHWHFLAGKNIYSGGFSL